MKKEIMWNNEEWIIDYGKRLFYKKVGNETEMLPINDSICYQLREFKDVICFQKGNDFYKIVNDKVVTMSEEEFGEVYYGMLHFIKLGIDRNSINYIASVISSILIEEIINKKYNVNVPLSDLAFAGKVTTLVQQFKEKFPHDIDMRINDISKNVIGVLPEYVGRVTLKEEVKKSLATMFEKNTSYLDDMMNQIYEDNKANFDTYADDIKRRQTRKPTIISFPFDDRLKMSDDYGQEEINKQFDSESKGKTI